MSETLRVGIIGLDTSHSIEFTQRMQAPDCPADQRVPGMRAASCLRFPSPFQSEKGQDERQQRLESWGVRVTRDFEEAIRGCDALMLEINDPSLHEQYFERCASLGLPLFLDKPIAHTAESGRRILACAASHGTRFFSSSNLRFALALDAVHGAIARPVFAHVYGALGAAPAGSSIVWYGVHSFEMLELLMGRGAISVATHRDESGVTCTVSYPEARRGVVELNQGAWIWGGEARTRNESRPFVVDETYGYRDILSRIHDFFVMGAAPVAVEDSMEVMSLLDTAERSLVSGKREFLGP